MLIGILGWFKRQEVSAISLSLIMKLYQGWW